MAPAPRKELELADRMERAAEELLRLIQQLKKQELDQESKDALDG